jgi:hypothetical protein
MPGRSRQSIPAATHSSSQCREKYSLVAAEVAAVVVAAANPAAVAAVAVAVNSAAAAAAVAEVNSAASGAPVAASCAACGAAAAMEGATIQVPRAAEISAGQSNAVIGMAAGAVQGTCIAAATTTSAVVAVITEAIAVTSAVTDGPTIGDPVSSSGRMTDTTMATAPG